MRDAQSWRNYVTDYYDERLSRFGCSPRALDWRDLETMQTRFRVLCGVADLDNSSIADVGSGLGDLYGFLKEQGWQGTYCGFEMVPSFVSVARRRYPDATFVEGEFLTAPIGQTFDWVLLSGALNLRFPGIEQVTRDTIQKMFSICNQGVAFNMVSSYVDFRNEILAYNEPERLFKFCKSLTRFVAIRHDYPLWEFTVYLYRNGR